MRDPSLSKFSTPARRRAFALLLGLSLTAAACGSGSDTTVAVPSNDEAATPQNEGSASDPASDDSSSESSSESSTGPVGETSDQSDTDSSEDATENLFPDIDVLDVATGDTVNLASELGGGDQHVLLWFYAPH